MVNKKINVLSCAFLLVFYVSAFSAKATSITTVYTWAYNNKLLSINHSFNQEDYNHYKNINRVYNDFTYYLNESASYPVIEKFANEFKIIAKKNNFSDWQTVECIIAFIQDMNYKNDGTYEYPRYPIETLVEKGGDCEDSAILLEAILRELGFDCVLVSPDKHMGVGIALKYEIQGNAFEHKNKYYYYIETTSAGWGIGDYPEHLSAAVAIYDPGEVADAKLLSEYSYSFKDYSASEINEPEITKAEPIKEIEYSEPEYEYNSSDNSSNTKPDDSYTIDVDNIIIDGEKEIMITKKVEQGGKEKIIATSK